MIGLQLSMPQLKKHLSHSRHAVGLAGENLVARALEMTGYQVSTTHERGDLTAVTVNGEIIYVEVKTARRGKTGVYRFTLWKHWQGRQCADHKNADFVVLLCVLKTGDCIPFVLPTSVIGDRHSISICNYPSDYQGWVAPYRQTLKSLSLNLPGGQQ